MSEKVWYHVVPHGEGADAATMWMLMRQGSDYVCKTWHLSPYDTKAVGIWMRMIERRKRMNLPLTPPPFVFNTTPVEQTFARIEGARRFFEESHSDPTLQQHVKAMFSRIAPGG
jgi:hypothetical protein